MSSPTAIQGCAFGLRHLLDTIGAFLGPLLGIAFMVTFARDMRSEFWIADIPSVLAVFWVRKHREPAQPQAGRPPIAPADLKRLNRACWIVVSVRLVFTLACYSEAFLISKASAEGLPLTLAPR